jgi:hypothetical protein
MNPQFLIAKLAANATDTSWSQAYSTLNFYVALSVSSTETTTDPLAQIGKETLEKLQREYFSLDEKTLDSIKLAVENTISSVDKSLTYSLVLVTNTADTLLIITAEEGSVLIKRGDKLGVIAQGQKGSVLSFSGPLKHHDIVVVQTTDFSRKISKNVISESLNTTDVTDISENIAPLIHSGASGGEAAIILLYTDPEMDSPLPEEEENTLEKKEEIPLDEKPVESKKFEEEVNDVTPAKTDSQRSSIFPLTPDVNLITKLKEKRKMILGLAILLLIIGLVGTLYFRSRQETSAENSVAITQALTTAQSEYDEGVALEPLNRPLAIDKFNSAQKILTDTKNKYPNDPETEQVTSLLSKVEQKLSEFSSGTKVENGEKLASSSDLELDSINSISVKGGTLFVTNKSNTLVTLSESGEIEETHELDSSTIIDATAANSEFAFVLTNSGVLRVNLKNGTENELFELDSARQAVEIYGSNIYLLNSSDNMVEKYAPSAYAATDYLTESLTKRANGLSIDGSVFVLYEDGTIEKFTRGAKDSFALSALQGKIGKKSYLYTEEDFTNVYILDTGNQRLLAVSQTGEVKQEFSWDIFKNANDFAVDEKNKIIYISTPQDIYSFTF